jgi:hypothetical protein
LMADHPSLCTGCEYHWVDCRCVAGVPNTREALAGMDALAAAIRQSVSMDVTAHGKVDRTR